MKLVKISPIFQITIPRCFRHHCRSGWFAVNEEQGILTLRQLDVQPAKSDQEIMNEIFRNCGKDEADDDAVAPF